MAPGLALGSVSALAEHGRAWLDTHPIYSHNDQDIICSAAHVDVKNNTSQVEHEASINNEQSLLIQQIVDGILCRTPEGSVPHRLAHVGDCQHDNKSIAMLLQQAWSSFSKYWRSGLHKIKSRPIHEITAYYVKSRSMNKHVAPLHPIHRMLRPQWTG